MIVTRPPFWPLKSDFLGNESEKLIAELLDLIPKNRQDAIVEAMEVLVNRLGPER